MKHSGRQPKIMSFVFETVTIYFVDKGNIKYPDFSNETFFSSLSEWNKSISGTAQYSKGTYKKFVWH